MPFLPNDRAVPPPFWPGLVVSIRPVGPGFLLRLTD